MAAKPISFFEEGNVQDTIDDISSFGDYCLKILYCQWVEFSSNKNTNEISYDDMKKYADNILQELAKVNPSENMSPMFTCQGVQLLFFDLDRDIESTFEKHELNIIKVKTNSADTVFMTVGDWIYPLFPGLSPFCKSVRRLFIFPDIRSQTKNAVVIVLLPQEECNALLKILTDLFCDYDESRQKRSVVSDATASYDVNSGGNSVSRFLINGSLALANRIESVVSDNIGKIEPKPEIVIDPGVQEYMQKTVNVVDQTSKASNFLASKLGESVTALGRYVAPYVWEKIEKYVPQRTDLTFVEELGEICNGLEKSVCILANSVSKNSTRVLEQRYGTQAGKISSNVFSIVGNLYAIRRDWSLFKPKSLAENIIKSTGKAVVEDLRNGKREPPMI